MPSPVKLSIIISARDEFPQIVQTCHAIIADVETFLKQNEWEIIIVDNCSKDPDSWRFLAERGMYFHRNIRILHDPLAGNVTARNKGAKIANGEVIAFCDAHMAFKVGSFKAMYDAVIEGGGIVHAPVQWMGGYEPSEPSYQYTIKLGEKLWGTWNRNIVSDKEPFYIPVCGHCILLVRRKEFLDFGGYNNYFRCYGGGEVYLDMKWYMLGSHVRSVPTALAYHLSAGRGYSFKQDDLIHNMMLLALSLGADAMAERVYIRYLGKESVNKISLDRLYSEAKTEARSDRELLLPRTVKSFYDVLIEKPWDKLNIEKFGIASSSMGIYDKSWTNNLTGEAKEYFIRSPLQADLQELIDKTPELSQHLYKPEG